MEIQNKILTVVIILWMIFILFYVSQMFYNEYVLPLHQKDFRLFKNKS